jgi:hypothetical protein
MLIGIIILVCGTWVFQDSLASILYYWGKDGQSWHYDHLLRTIRALVGVGLVTCGVILL